MAWEQVTPFDINKMGTRVGYCLQNVRLGFGIKPLYDDAKAAMEGNRRAGTLHDISTLPTNVAVPVFLDTDSPYEHVIASDHGVLYSDGKRLTSLKGFKVFGWGEFLNGTQVVKAVNQSQPQTTPVQASTAVQLGSRVTLASWTDYNGRALKKTRSFYFVKQIAGDRVVLVADSMSGAVYAAVKKNNLRVV